MPELSFTAPFGQLSAAHMFALAARRHMHRFGTRVEHFAEVAINARLMARTNPLARFREPITAVLVEPRLRGVRTALLVGVTVLAGLITYGQVRTTVAAPPTLRSIHPAPPAEITFRGRTMTLTGLDNPLRQHPESIAAYSAEGKRVYYQNCLPCHGDHLDGQGHYAVGFNPLPANFQDNGTIAQLTESFVFWRIAKGGPGLPREGAPWNSAMPRWEDFLSEREIWSVTLFLYDQTGWKPRTWETHE